MEREDERADERAVPLLDPEDGAEDGRRTTYCTFVLAPYSLPEKRLFLAKCVFVWAATYAFIPLIAAHQRGRITATVYASLLVAIHVLFIVIYFYKVNFRRLDGSWRSLAARVCGLGACVYLLPVALRVRPSRGTAAGAGCGA